MDVFWDTNSGSTYITSDILSLILDSHALVHITFAFVQEKKRVCMHLGINVCAQLPFCGTV